MIPFAQVQGSQAMTYPKPIQNWIMLDRLMSSTSNDAGQVIGGGILLMPEHPQPDREIRALRWQAERQSRLSSKGQLVHRLVLNIVVNDTPVSISIIAAKPSIAIHIATDHGGLRGRMESGLPDVMETLNRSGWTVDSYHFGRLSNDGEDA
jgi:hypothetical protein